LCYCTKLASLPDSRPGRERTCLSFVEIEVLLKAILQETIQLQQDSKSFSFTVSRKDWFAAMLSRTVQATEKNHNARHLIKFRSLLAALEPKKTQNPWDGWFYNASRHIDGWRSIEQKVPCCGERIFRTTKLLYDRLEPQHAWDVLADQIHVEADNSSLPRPGDAYQQYIWSDFSIRYSKDIVGGETLIEDQFGYPTIESMSDVLGLSTGCRWKKDEEISRSFFRFAMACRK